MILDFRYEALPMRVRFGAGALASLPEELDEIGLQRVLVLCSPGQEDTGELVASALGERCVGMRADAVMHVPADVAERARTEAVSLGADGCVAVGGGSAIGLGKAIALKHDLPIVAVPTTYAGSEMTPVWGLTTDGRKETGRDPKVLPRSVVYDPELTLESAGGHVGDQWDQCHGPRGGGALRARCHADHLPDGGRGSSRAGGGLATHRCRQRRCRWPQSGAVWSMVVRCRPGRDDDVAAPQAVPCARRNPEPLRTPTPTRSSCPTHWRSTSLTHPMRPRRCHVHLASPRARPTGYGNCRGSSAPPTPWPNWACRNPTSSAIAEEVTSRSYGNPRPITYDSVRDLLSAAWAGQWPVADPASP